MNELKRNGSGYADPTAFNAMKNFVGGIKMEVYRGDIFYVRNFVRVAGAEQTANRPAVVVSNDIGNKHSDICQVVYLTTKDKKPLPTHVKVLCKTPSTALCEQVCSVAQERLTEYIRTCTTEEMEDIDRALMVSLGLDMKQKNLDDCETIDDVIKYQDSKQIDDLKMKLEGAERMLDEEKAKHLEEKSFFEKHKKELNCRLEEEIAKKEHLQTVLDATGNQNEETIKLTTERDLYKNLYEQTIERMIAR